MRIELAVNGTLMRGLELNHNLLELGGVFVEEALTASLYRLWSTDYAAAGLFKHCSSDLIMAL